MPSKFRSVHEQILISGYESGVIIFLVLTVVTIAARPAPVRLAGEHLSSLEGRLANSASDLWKVGKDFHTSLCGAGGQVESQRHPLSNLNRSKPGMLCHMPISARMPHPELKP